MCGQIAMCKCAVLSQNNLLLSQNESQSKRKLLIALGDFLYKVWIVQ